MAEVHGTSQEANVTRFVQNLHDSGLLSSKEIEEALHSLVKTPGSTDNALSQQLVETGRLTNFQVALLREGKIPETLIGNYEILDRLGAGGMGTVFKARHRRMKRIVALKVLASKLASNDTFVQRFQREVEAIAQLSHPNIVMAYDAGVSEVGHFLVMEFVDGRDLDSLVARQGPLSLALAVQCIIQAAQGLEYVHGRSMVHRDIKPANLLRDTQGTVKVTDLGLARFRSSEPGATGITQAGQVMGTADYMSPEQAVDSTTIDQRTDIYSLGATLFYLLVGKPPYQGNSIIATLLQHRDAPIPSLRGARPDVPAELDGIYRRMLAKLPADRYQSMTEVLQALRTIEKNFEETATIPPAQAATIMAVSSNLQIPPLPGAITQGKTLPPGKPETIPVERRKVILVEPSRTQSGIIRRFLQTQGISQVVAVASGKEALAALQAEKPDVIVCALHLPDMTGVELAQQVPTVSSVNPGFVLISSETDGPDAGSLSKYGKGIVLHKPFTAEKLAEALRLVAGPSAAAREKKERHQLRVLIVDDSTPARLHVRSVLQSLGLTLFTEAVDGAAAVAALARDNFDLVVTDYNMPFMDGRGLVGYIRQNPATAAIPIILVTTETDPAKLEAVRQMGVTVCDKTFPSRVVQSVLDQIARVS